MDFLHPGRLWLIIVWLVMIALTLWSARRRARVWTLLAQPGRPPSDRKIAFFTATLLLIIALAQPRWGRMFGANIPPGRDVVLLMDVSRSMSVEDAVPSRLGVAIESATSLVKAMAREPGDRVAIVAFAGAGVVRCGLTENMGAAIDVLRRLRPASVQPGGTDLGAALDVAMGAFDEHDYEDGRMIVVFSDGEDLAGGWNERVATLKARSILVNTVAIGDADVAHPVPGPGPSGVLIYQGQPVASKRSDVVLDALASSTQGAFLPLGLAVADLDSLYRDRIAPAAKRARIATHPPDRTERFPLFVLMAFVLLIVPRRLRRPQRNVRRLAYVAPIALLIFVGPGAGDGSPKALVEQGRVAYESGRYADAIVFFVQATKIADRSAVAPFGAGASLFRLGRYQESIAAYRLARERGDAEMKMKVDYAIGNALVMLGDPESAISFYDASIDSKLSSKSFTQLRDDARINREYARSLLNKSRPPDESQTPPDPEKNRRPEPSKKKSGKPEGPNGEGSKGQGGAGGNDPDNRPDDSHESPESRLESALDQIQESLKNRLPEPPAKSESGDRKDW